MSSNDGGEAEISSKMLSFPVKMEVEDVAPMDSNNYPGFPQVEAQTPEMCVICLKYYTPFADRDLEQSGKIFQTISRKLNISQTQLSGLWDFAEEFVPVCNSCFDFTKRIFELETQLEIIRVELESRLTWLSGTIKTAESENRRVEPLTDQRLLNWRGMVLKRKPRKGLVITSNKPSTTVVPDSSVKRGRGRPRKTPFEPTQEKKEIVIKGECLEASYPNRLARRTVDSSYYEPEDSMSPEHFDEPAASDNEQDHNFDDTTEQKGNQNLRALRQRKVSSINRTSTDSAVNEEDDDDEEWIATDTSPGSSQSKLKKNKFESTSSSIPLGEERKKRPYIKRKIKIPKAKPEPIRKKPKIWVEDPASGKLFCCSTEIMHLGDHSYQCTACNHVSTAESHQQAKYQMVRHMRVVHLQIFKCPHCSKSFYKALGLKVHIEIIHNKVRTVCPICDKPLRPASVGNHVWTHKSAEEREESLRTGSKDIPTRARDPKYPCPTCDKVLPSPALLRFHQRSHEEGLKPRTHMCNICGRLFVAARHLRYHIEDAHREGEPDKSDWIPCAHCDKKFRRRCDHKKHNRIHAKETACSCEICGKAFKYINLLQRHYLVHQEEKPCPCSLCTKSFKTKYDLGRHMDSCHPNGILKKPRKKPVHPNAPKADEIIVCRYCQKTFCSRKSLRRHYNNVHGEQTAKQIKRKAKMTAAVQGGSQEQQQYF